MKRAAVALIVVLAAVAAWFFLGARGGAPRPEWSGVLESREIRAGSRVGGRVAAVLVEEGRLVEGGTVLIRLEQRELLAEKAQLEAQVAQAEAAAARLSSGYRPEEITQAEASAKREEAALQALREGPRPQELQQAEADYQAALADARNTEASFQRLDPLFASGDLSAQEHDDSRARRDLARARAESSRQRLQLLRAGTREQDLRGGEQRLRQAQANAKMLREGFRKEDIAEARARLAEARALLEANAVRLDETVVRAPVRCRVESVSVRPGDLAAAGQAVVTLLELDQVWARLFVPEPELGSIHVGDTVSLRTDTYPDRRYSGVVEQINSQAEYIPRNVQTLEDRSHLVFGVRVRPDNSKGDLKPGMTVFATLKSP